MAETIEMTFPKAKLLLVVAMASDKDHSGFARELLSGMASLFAFSVVVVTILLKNVMDIMAHNG